MQAGKAVPEVLVVVVDDRLAAFVAHARGHVLEHGRYAAVGGDDARRVVVVLGLHVLDDDGAHLFAGEGHARIIAQDAETLAL
jgi:hypothetical protein